jgi:hypothetical protein
MSHAKPHISPALAHLRFAVTTTCAMVALSAVVQAVIFLFAQYTDARWDVPRVSAEAQQTLQVVTPSAAPSPGPAVSGPPASPGEGAEGVQGGSPMVKSALRVRSLTETQAAERQRTPSRQDGMMRGFWDTAAAAGSIGVIAGFVFVFAGLVIAGGASVPGVDATVTALMGAMLLTLGCLPLQGWLPALPWPGVFGAYEHMTFQVDAASGPSLAMLAAYALMPVLASGVSVAVGAYFRLGVCKGVIVTSVNELDVKLEAEMAELRRRGVTTHFGGRSVGALNQAIGVSAAPAAAPAPVPTPAARVAAPAETPPTMAGVPAAPAGGKARGIIDRLAAEADVPGAGRAAREPDKRPI